VSDETTLEAKAEELGSGRTLTATTLGMFGPVLAIWLIAMIFALAPIGALLGSLVGNANMGIWVTWVGWTLGAGLVFLRPVENRLGEFLFDLRPLMATESTRLAPLWREVCADARVDPAHYSLRIEDADALNAYAAAGHLVTVTRGAMALPDDMLKGVLAHELGHHRDLHPVASILSWWFLLPIGLLDWCLRLVVRVTSFVLSLFEGWLILILAIVVLCLMAMRFLLFIPIRAADFFTLALGRAAEFAADRHAVDAGYAQGLLKALHLFLEAGFDDNRPAGFARLYATHPPLRKRVVAIEKRMEERGEDPLLVSAPMPANA
jgi:Zn-dependent protease with chaperone function